MILRPPISTLFPYTTLFRSKATTGSTKKGLRIPSPGFSPSFVPRRNRFRQGWTANRTHSPRSEEHTSELQSHSDLVCRLLLEKKKKKKSNEHTTHTDKVNKI